MKPDRKLKRPSASLVARPRLGPMYSVIGGDTAFGAKWTFALEYDFRGFQRDLADFTTTTPELKLSVHTAFITLSGTGRLIAVAWPRPGFAL